jgi:hypothetical protein
MNSILHDGVGPVLEVGDVAHAIVAAIRSQQTGVQVQDRDAYLRVLVSARCHVTRSAIERELGRAFELPGDLERVMLSFKGAFRVTDEGATWELVRP